MNYQKVDPTSSAAIYRGDPRTREIDIDGWFKKILGDYKDKDRSDNRAHLYGSDAGFCARRNVLVEHNDVIESLSNSAGDAFMAIGSALENLIADGLMRSGRLLAQNRRLVLIPELKIAGKVDFYIFDNNDKFAAVECKSTGELPMEPKPQHLAQIQTYAAVNGVDVAYLTYVSRKIVWKQPLTMKTFVVDTSPEALREKMRIAALSRIASDRELAPPVPPHFRKHTECHYCEFRDYFCYAQRPGQGGQLPLLPAKVHEMSTEELVNLNLEAAQMADAIMYDRPNRLMATIQDLWEIRETFSRDLRPLLKSEFATAKAKASQ